MRTDAARTLWTPHALLPDGWADDVLLTWDANGSLTGVTPHAPDAQTAPRVAGIVVPGMPNLHSHAFQRSFSGLAECRGGEDDFWAWRDRMYRVAAALTPAQLEDIATQAYVEMLRAGYTSVCEFHYIHHDPQGRPYVDPSEMGKRLAAAAQRAGIGMTLLPVLYQAGNFGGQPSLPSQRRFINGVDALLDIVERLRVTHARVGLAPHSLRAVTPEALRDAVGAVHACDGDAPVHIHIAEQRREVDDCLAWSGQRPVRWLLDHAGVDARWCLVHATHADADELRALARSGATVGLCPTTEANLGDGVFDARTYVDGGGRWGIGSDSQASIDVAEELRWLEYTQRLAVQRRPVLATAAQPQVADRLWLAAVEGGARAAARPIGGLRVGQRADFLVLADDGLPPQGALAAHVFAHHPRRAIDEVWVGGERRVAQDAHALAEPVRQRFQAARRRLLDET